MGSGVAGQASSCIFRKREEKGKETKGRSSWSPVPADAVLGVLHWPRDVLTAPPWPLPSFPFVFIYLLPFVEFPFYPVPSAYVVPTIPLQSPSCLCSCLSVCHKENKTKQNKTKQTKKKTASHRTCAWSLGGVRKRRGAAWSGS